MSYILDALRKADAERERDPARGIHAQPAALQPGAGPGRRSSWPWIAGATLGLAIAAALAFWPPAPPAAAPAVVGAVTPGPAVRPVPPVAAPPPVPAAEVQPAPPPMPVAPPAVAPAAAAPAVAVARPAAAASAAQAPAAPAAVAAVTPASPPAAAATDRVVAFADLPPDVQRDLPKLAINGGVHSDNAAQRMLIVGGQVMVEGNELAPGLVLEQIRPKAAVLRFRGLRYSLPY